MNWSEATTGFQQGVVDGQENPTNGINIPLKIWDYHTFHCDWHYIIDPLMLGVNPRVWKSFSPEDQKLLLECGIPPEQRTDRRPGQGHGRRPQGLDRQDRR